MWVGSFDEVRNRFGLAEPYVVLGWFVSVELYVVLEWYGLVVLNVAWEWCGLVERYVELAKSLKAADWENGKIVLTLEVVHYWYVLPRSFQRIHFG